MPRILRMFRAGQSYSAARRSPCFDDWTPRVSVDSRPNCRERQQRLIVLPKSAISVFRRHQRKCLGPSVSGGPPRCDSVPPGARETPTLIALFATSPQLGAAARPTEEGDSFQIASDAPDSARSFTSGVEPDLASAPRARGPGGFARTGIGGAFKSAKRLDS